MRKLIVSNICTAMLVTLLVAGWSSPVRQVSAQATTTKPDLITRYRANAQKLLEWKDENKALRAQYDALAFSWADGDFTGSNGGITATQFTTAVTNLSLVQAAFDSGGTISSGFPTTVYRIAQ